MNATLKTVLLTLLTLSVLTIAIIELMGISSNAFVNKYKGGASEAQMEANNHAGHNHSDHNHSHEAAQPDSKADQPKTTISFDKMSHDFGTIKDGAVVEHVYRFTNTGTHPLIIDEVIATCGCTIPAYTKTPVAPGAKGEVAISFNSKGRLGNVDKNIIVKSNAQEENISLFFKAVVK